MLGQMTAHLGAEHYGAERAAAVEARAEGIVAQELQRRRWSETELRERAKGDPEKLAVAVRLRAETAVTVKWIAGRLQMGGTRASEPPPVSPAQ